MHWISPRNISRSFRIVLALCVIFTALVAFSPRSRAANGMAGATSRAKSATAWGFAEDSKTQSDDGLPAGTVLPVRLPSISSKNAKAALAA